MASTYILRGIEEEGGIPEGSKVLVVSLPNGNRVFEDYVVGDELPLALDPGKYAYVVSKMVDSNAPSGREATELQYNGEFFHDCSEKDFDIIRRLHPQAAYFRNTSLGGKWFCKMGWGCRVSTSTELSMVLHECEAHLGISKDDLLKSKKAQLIYKTKAAETMQKRKAEEDRKMGRPTPAAKG